MPRPVPPPEPRALSRRVLGRYPFERGRSRATRVLRRRLPPGGRTVVRTRDGCSLVLDLTQFPSQQLFWFGTWERPSADLMARQLQPGAVAFDVGANIGIFTVLMASKVGSTGIVHAFEPDPRSFPFLTENIEQNRLGNVLAHQRAVSDMPGQIGLDREADAAFSHIQAGGGSHAVVVPMTTIDEYATDMERLDLVKVDVEGAEPRVLAGAALTLRRLKPTLLVECAAHHLARSDVTPRQLLRQLEDLGYRAMAISSEREVGSTSARVPASDNLWCLPRD